LLALVWLAGCADSSMVLKGNLNKLQQEQLAILRQNRELQGRVDALDKDNQELQTSLAQAKQQTKVAEDQVALLRQQLGTLTSQLAALRDEKKSVEEKTAALTASLQRRGGVTITPNNSLNQTLPTIHLPGVEVRRDGDVVRIELPEHRLFNPGTNQLVAGADRLIASIAADLQRAYPDQMIGVEGHTDSDLAQGYQWRTSMQLTVAQASIVEDLLVTQGRLRPNQLFVVGHGANHPIVSNATPAGKQRNRRIELVIYPERAG
jgi:flagellar motor protein MotB